MRTSAPPHSRARDQALTHTHRAAAARCWRMTPIWKRQARRTQTPTLSRSARQAPFVPQPYPVSRERSATRALTGSRLIPTCPGTTINSSARGQMGGNTGPQNQCRRPHQELSSGCAVQARPRALLAHRAGARLRACQHTAIHSLLGSSGGVGSPCPSHCWHQVGRGSRTLES